MKDGAHGCQAAKMECTWVHPCQSLGTYCGVFKSRQTHRADFFVLMSNGRWGTTLTQERLWVGLVKGGSGANLVQGTLGLSVQLDQDNDQINAYRAIDGSVER